MRAATIAFAAFAAVAMAAPTKRQAAKGGPGDGVVLNYALTLEHLEAEFYKEALAKFTLADFQAYGLDNVFYKNLQTIAMDEATHVSFLTTALTAAGVTPVVPNEYDFGLTDVKTFLATSQVLEDVGVSAYLGAAQYIASATYLEAAGSILTVEARHNSYIRASQRPQQLSPFPSPFDVPCTINQVYTLASPFITKNNNPNANLPVKAYSGIAYTGGQAPVGSTVSVTVAKQVDAKNAYFLAVTGPIAAVFSSNDGTTYSVTIPEGTPMGQGYLVLTSGGAPTDDNTLAVGIVPIQDEQYGIVSDEICTYNTGTGSYGSSPSGSSSGPMSGSNGSMSGSKTSPAYPSSTVVEEDCETVAPAPMPAPYKAPAPAPAAPAPAPAMPATNPVQQIGDGQVQAKPAQQIADGQVQAPA